MGNPSHLRVVGQTLSADDEQQALNLVFAALSDPVRREILDRLDGHDLLVSEVAADLGLSCRVLRCGVRRPPDGVTGSQDYLHRSHGLCADQIAATARDNTSDARAGTALESDTGLNICGSPLRAWMPRTLQNGRPRTCARVPFLFESLRLRCPVV